jgi:hypothetical protein
MTEMQRSDGVVLKVDQRQRVRRTAAQREALLAEYDGSGLSGPEFARVAGVKYQTLAGWIQRRRRGKRLGLPGRRASVKWVEAVVKNSAPDACLSLQLPGGVRVAVADEKQVVLAAALLRALARPC